MTADEHQHTTPIADRLRGRLAVPVLAGHLAVVVHADGCLSWHAALMDPASRRMVFPWYGTTDAPVSQPTGLVRCLVRACNELMAQEKHDTM